MPTADDTNNPFLGLPHYVTGTYTRNSTFLDDLEYSRALDVFVKGCADIFLTDSEGNAMLGKRKVEPQPDWWFVGGRTRPGDTPAEGAARNVKRELGLAIETRRFVHVNTYSFVSRAVSFDANISRTLPNAAAA